MSIKKPCDYDTMYEPFVYRNEIDQLTIDKLIENESCAMYNIKHFKALDWSKPFGEVWYDKEFEQWCCAIYRNMCHYSTVLADSPEELKDLIDKKYNGFI